MSKEFMNKRQVTYLRNHEKWIPVRSLTGILLKYIFEGKGTLGRKVKFFVNNS